MNGKIGFWIGDKKLLYICNSSYQMEEIKAVTGKN